MLASSPAIGGRRSFHLKDKMMADMKAARGRIWQHIRARRVYRMCRRDRNARRKNEDQGNYCLGSFGGNWARMIFGQSGIF